MNQIKELKSYIKGKSIAEVSRKLKVSRQTVYNWLNGKHNFTLKNWEKLINSK